MSAGSTSHHLLLQKNPPALWTQTWILTIAKKWKKFLRLQINSYIYHVTYKDKASPWNPTFSFFQSALRPAADFFHLTHSPGHVIFCGYHQSALYFLSRLCQFQVHKAPSCSYGTSLYCYIVFSSETKKTSQNSKFPLEGFPSFNLPPFFFTDSKAQSRNVSAVRGGDRAKSAQLCRVGVSHLLIYSLTSCVSAVCRRHAEVAPPCTSGCLKWSRSTTSVMMRTMEMMMETTGMTKMKGEPVRHNLTFITYCL